MDLFSANQTCVIFSGILLHAGREWDFGSSYRRINTDPTKSKRKGKWEVCKHAKRQKAKKALDYVSCFPLNFFRAPAACCCFTTEQSVEASLFVNVTHLISKGGDSRLNLWSFEIYVFLGQIETNFLYFTSYLHYRQEDNEVKILLNPVLIQLGWISTGTLFCCCETFEILDFYEAPSSQSNGSNILGNSFSFHSYFRVD